MKKITFSVFLVLFLGTIGWQVNAQVYCAASGGSTTYEHIKNVTFAGINNTTTTHSGYNDFTSQVASVSPGDTKVISVDLEVDGGDYSYAFIDWNKNGILDDAGEVYTITTQQFNSGVYSTNIVVPANAQIGQTRMRVVIGWLLNPANPCGTISWGEVEDYTVDVQALGPPAPVYCGPLIFSTVEPISFVQFAGISNRSSAATTSPAHEDFTAISGNVDAGATYPIVFEGNTNGNYTNRFFVFVDWNQNGILNDPGEVYIIPNYLVGSTGVDGKQILGAIQVPADALPGNTRMRVKKTYGSSANINPCLSQSSYGQAEDYTINVTVALGNVPDLVCPIDINVNNDAGLCTAVVTFADAIATDIEDGVLVAVQTAGPVSGSAFPTGATTIEYTATDSDGNGVTCEFVITVLDVESPVAVCKDLTVELDQFGSATITGSDINDASTDNCGITSYSMTIAGGPSSGALGTMYTGSNGGATGGTVYFDIVVGANNIDLTEFNINTPDAGAITMQVYSVVGTSIGKETNIALWTMSGTAAGNGAGLGNPSNVVIASPISLNANTTYGIALVLDAAHSHRYSNGDGTNENFSNADISLALGKASNLPFSGSIFTPRIFNGDVIYDIVGGSGSAFNGIFNCSHLGEQILTLTVTDDAGNTSTCTSTVTVVDVTAPDVVCVAGNGIDVYLDANGEASIDGSDLIVSIDEACGYTVSIAGAGSGGGTTGSLTTTFAGGNGNFGNMFDLVAINEVTIQSFDVNAKAGAGFEVEVYAKSGTWVGSANDPSAWTLIGTAATFVNNGDNVPSSLDLNLEYLIPAGETHAFYVTPTSPNATGLNYTNGSLTGNVFAQDANLQFLEGAAKPYPFTGSTFDPRMFNGNIHYTTGSGGGGGGSTLDFTCADLGVNSIEVTVTDSSGNATTCTAIVNVIDNIAPVLVCQTVVIEIGANGSVLIDPADLIDNIASFDNCEITILAADITEVTCADIGQTITVTVFASDSSGNTTSCQTTITVVDALAPEIACPVDQTQDPGAGSLYYIVPDYFATGEATATDNCTSPVTITSQSPAAGDAIADGVYTVTLTAEDDFGNVSTCNFELIVESVLGNNSNSLEASVILYPNPATSVVNLVNKSNISLNELIIFDINGKRVKQMDLRGMQGDKSVDVSSLSNGVYMVQIIGDRASTNKRLIIE